MNKLTIRWVVIIENRDGTLEEHPEAAGGYSSSDEASTIAKVLVNRARTMGVFMHLRVQARLFSGEKPIAFWTDSGESLVML